MNLEQVRQYSEDVAKICNDESNGLRRQMATFNYVYNYLGNWASEAEVGSEVREDIKTLNSAITMLKDKTLELCTVINEYVEGQTSANSGN